MWQVYRGWIMSNKWVTPFHREGVLSIVDYWVAVKMLNALRHLGVVISNEEMREITNMLERNVFGDMSNYGRRR
jgi:hypothetical protein